MKTTSLTALLALLVLSVTSFGQLSNGGEVVDVIDGRTIVVATPGGRVKVELQFIQVPQPGHQFHGLVKGHLQKMLVGKVVEFKPSTIFPDRVTGRVLFNNIDVSQQMLRDGAATHVAKEMTGQGKGEFDLYASLEAAAKTEKRGVWSVNVPFPTVVESVNAEPPRPVLAAAFNRSGSTSGLGLPDAPKHLESWVGSLPFDHEKAAAGLRRHTDPSGTYTSISTPPAVLNFASESGTQAVECMAIYARPGSLQRSEEPLFALRLRSASNPTLLSSTGVLTIVAERYVVPLTPLIPGSADIRHYRISKAFLVRIATTRSVEFQIDGFKATLSEEAKELFNHLLSAAE